MSKFSFNVHQDLIPIVQNQIRDISALFKHELAIQVHLPHNDPELSSSWKYSLLEDLQADCHNLLSLLNNAAFGRQAISLDYTSAESSLRACSAIRHKLRSTLLAELNDSDVESGNLNIAKLPTKLQRPYACYAFLAYLQESIIQSLQPN